MTLRTPPAPRLSLATPRFARFSRSERARRSRGMTLVEIMIVVVIMALMATAVGVAVLPRLKAARVTQTRTDSQTVASAAMQYLIDNPGEGCPTVEQLAGGYLSASTRLKDAWDNEFVIECSGDDVIVRSAGPDGNMGTEDDI